MATKREHSDNITKISPTRARAEHARMQAALIDGQLKLSVGDFVKRAFRQGAHVEHMWVKLEKINRKTLIGKLDNVPASITDVSRGDTIKFKPEDIEAFLPGNFKGAC